MYHLGLYCIGCNVTGRVLSPIADFEEVGDKCGNNRFLEGFEVVGFPKQFFFKFLAMSLKDVKVSFGLRCDLGEKLEGGYLNFNKAEFFFFVESVADDHGYQRYKRSW